MSAFKSEIESAVSFLKNGKTILYPTDTVWGLGGDSSKDDVAKRIFDIKKRPESKALIHLVSSVEMLRNYANINKDQLELLTTSNKPTTVILENVRNISSLAMADDGTAAFRVVTTGFCHELVNSFSGAIISTSSNVSGEPTPASYSNISERIKNEVDHVCALNKEENPDAKPSRILKFVGNNIVVIRE